MNIFQNNLEEKIANVVSGPLKNLGYELVRVKLTSGATNNVLQIMFDRIDEIPVSIDDCEKVHFSVSPILDIESIMTGKYTLEISSPGVNRPLTRDKDLIKNIGSLIKLTTKTPTNNRRKFSGIIKAVMDNALSIELRENNEIIEIVKSNIIEIKLLFETQKKENK